MNRRNKRRERFEREYEDAVKVRVPNYNAELAFVISNHAMDRIKNRCKSDKSTMSRKLKRFLRNCSEDVLLEMVIAAQEMGFFGVRTEDIAFVFKGYYLTDVKGVRVTLIKLVTCADESIWGRKFLYAGSGKVSVVLTKDTVTYLKTEDPNKG